MGSVGSTMHVGGARAGLACLLSQCGAGAAVCRSAEHTINQQVKAVSDAIGLSSDDEPPAEEDPAVKAEELRREEEAAERDRAARQVRNPHVSLLAMRTLRAAHRRLWRWPCAGARGEAARRTPGKGERHQRQGAAAVCG